jgi:hypothetical protein
VKSLSRGYEGEVNARVEGGSNSNGNNVAVNHHANVMVSWSVQKAVIRVKTGTHAMLIAGKGDRVGDLPVDSESCLMVVLPFDKVVTADETGEPIVGASIFAKSEIHEPRAFRDKPIEQQYDTSEMVVGCLVFSIEGTRVGAKITNWGKFTVFQDMGVSELKRDREIAKNRRVWGRECCNFF